MSKFLAVLGAVALIVGGFFMWQTSTRSAAATPRQVTLANGKTVEWPPQLGKRYPALELVDRTGKIVRLEDFKGKVIVVEPIGMNCAACNAFSGGAKRGGYKGETVQRGLESIEKYFPQYAGGVALHDERIIFVQLLLYDLRMQGPTKEDAKLWAEHFGLDKHKNTYVLAGGQELVGPASYNIIPGFQLIDKNFILRSDAAGDHPKESMWERLLPMVPQLLKE